MPSYINSKMQGPQGLLTSSEYKFFRSSFSDFGKSLSHLDVESGWVCNACSYHNADYHNIVCSMCGVHQAKQNGDTSSSSSSSENPKLGTNAVPSRRRQMLSRRPSLLASRDLGGILEQNGDNEQEDEDSSKCLHNDKVPNDNTSSLDNSLSFTPPPNFNNTTINNPRECPVNDDKKPAATVVTSFKKIIQVDKLGDVLDLPPMERMETGGSTDTEFTFYSEMGSSVTSARLSTNLVLDGDEGTAHNLTTINTNNGIVATSSCDDDDIPSINDDHNESLSDFFQEHSDVHVQERKSSLWVCEFCTFVNTNPLHLVCEVCQIARATFTGADVHVELPPPDISSTQTAEENKADELLLTAEKRISAEELPQEFEDLFMTEVSLVQAEMLDEYKKEHEERNGKQIDVNMQAELQFRPSLQDESTNVNSVFNDYASALALHQQTIGELERMQAVHNQRRSIIEKKEGPNVFDSMDSAEVVGGRPKLKRTNSKLAMTWIAQQRMLDDWKNKVMERSNDLSNLIHRERDRSITYPRGLSFRRSSA